jgi:hypothetical protein
VPVQFGIGWQVRPAGVEGEVLKVTGPVKPPTALTVIVEEPELPVRIAAGVVAPAEIVKSCAGATWYVIVPLS